LEGRDGHTYISSVSFDHVTGSNSVSIAGACLTIDNRDTGSISLCDYYATFEDKIGQSKGEISGGYITLFGTSSTPVGCGGRTELGPGVAEFVGKDLSEAAGASSYTRICKDDVYVMGGGGSVRIYAGATTWGNSSEADTKLDETNINKGTIIVRGMDGTSTTINGAAITQDVESGSALETYIYPGTIESTGESAKFAVEDGSISLTAGGTEIKLNPNALPSGTYVYFQQIDICVDGKTKKAWVLMSDPAGTSNTGGDSGDTDNTAAAPAQ
jgi:hypothetical protein